MYSLCLHLLLQVCSLKSQRSACRSIPDDMDGHSVSMAVSYVEFLSSLFGTPLSSAGRARSYSDDYSQASYAPSSPVHWLGANETDCGQGHFEHSKEDKEIAFPPTPTVKITRSTSD
ncbi:unnamed protein product [Durusdinium trenchii]|uniref:Uncharacterized protein n=1 Tax=Durusdinium trenchii TaxID=1381693 RepID=A0ABP0SVJ8_9DINO